ncbi:hypothetical protein C9J85_04970 [Haloferax sp. wsp5]|nr:hypothetical protein C9J85_04970 [Haloferax sp. wsp5]
MSGETDDTKSLDRPTFRGCVFCYSAEWAYYGAKKAAKSVSGANKSTAGVAVGRQCATGNST